MPPWIVAGLATIGTAIGAELWDALSNLLQERTKTKRKKRGKK